MYCSHDRGLLRHRQRHHTHCICMVFLLPVSLLLTPGPAASSILHPSTDQDPFEKIDIYADRMVAVRNQDHQTVSGYPSWLTAPNALIIRYRGGVFGDTLAAAHSYANDCTFIDSRATDPGYVQYAVDPPRFASSVYFLTTGYYLFNDVNTYDDWGHPILLVTTLHEGGGSHVDTMRVGIDLRNYRSGTVAACADPLLESRLPQNPLAGEVWRGPWGGTDSIYYDVQEIVIPPGLRNTRITSIQLDSQYEWAHCYGSVNLYSGERINGISVDSRFHAYRPDGTQVATQSQLTGIPYGGYVHAGSVVGTFGTMRAWGCFLTCCSMVHNYYGTTCTPEALNQYLQQNQGFRRDEVARIVAILGQSQGDSVRVRAEAYRLQQGWTVLIEHGAYANPVATLELLQDTPGHTEGWARISALHGSPDLLNLNDMAFLFLNVRGDIAAKYPDGSSKFELERYPVSQCIAALEQALADSVPSFVHTRIDSKGAHHWVLADGMRAHFFPATGAHRGTYTVHDPASVTRDELLSLPLNNELTEGRIARKLGARSLLVGDAVFVMSLTGTAVLEITDPVGRTIRYDPENDQYVSDIPSCDADRESAIWDPADSTAAAGVADAVEIRDAMNGEYRIAVIGEEVGDFGISLLDFDTAGGVTGWAGSGATSPSGRRVYVATFSSQPGVGIEVHEDAVGIPGGNEGELSSEFGLEVPSPYRAGQALVLQVQETGQGVVAVYDVQGRRIQVLLADEVAAGRLELRWDGRTEFGSRAPAGVYYLEARIGSAQSHRTIVLVR